MKRNDDDIRSCGGGLVGQLVAAGLGFGAGVLAAGITRQFRPPEKTVDHPVRTDYAVHDPQFTRTLGRLLPPAIVPGNRVTTLVNGDQIFPAMLAAIRSARRTITLETYVYWSGRIGHEFAEALAERARAGVRCHVLLDWFGSKKMSPSSLHLMRRAGVEVVRYHRRWWHVTRLNHRTHRKLLAVDGLIGFTGGVGIADEWAGNAQDENHWRDNHYRVEGPVVAQLQSAFTDNWLKKQHVVLHDESYFPDLATAGELPCQVFQSSPDEGSESMQLMYLMGIGAARRSIRIATGYFVPDRLTIAALLEARARGVEVDIIVPGPHIDFQVVRYASRDRWGDLLAAGVRIYEFMPTMYHTKAMIVDELWTSIGSTNFDNRSFRLNDEANLNVYDGSFALEQVEWFEQDKQRCRAITLRRWTTRDRDQKLFERGADVIGSQL